jgi:hypothetical protein
MRKDRQFNTPFGGILGAVFYSEFRDLEFNEALISYVDALYEAIEGNESLKNELTSDSEDKTNNFLWKGSSIDGEFNLRFEFNMKDEKKKIWIDLMMNTLDKSIDDGGLFPHGENMRRQLKEIAGNDYDHLVRIFQHAPQVQAAMLMVRIRLQKKSGENLLDYLKDYFSEKEGNREQALVEKIEKEGTRSKDEIIAIKEKIFERAQIKKIELDLLQRHHYLIVGALLKEKKVKDLSQSDMKQMMNYFATRPGDYVNAKGTPLPFPINEETKKDDFKRILNSILTIALKTATKDIRIFENFLQVFQSAHADVFQGKKGHEMKRRLYEAAEEVRASKGQDDQFHWKHTVGAKFSWVKGWRLPQVWNAITFWEIFKKLITTGLLVVAGGVFAFFLFTAVSNMGIGLLGVSFVLPIGGYFFAFVAGFFVLFWLLVHKVSSSGYKFDQDLSRRYHLMGNPARKAATRKTEIILLGVFATFFLLMILIPSLSMGVYLSVVMGAFVLYYYSHGLLLHIMSNRELKHLLQKLNRLDNPKKGLDLENNLKALMSLKVPLPKKVETKKTNIDFSGPSGYSSRAELKHELIKAYQEDKRYAKLRIAEVEELSFAGETVLLENQYVPFVRRDLYDQRDIYPRLYSLVALYEEFKAEQLNGSYSFPRTPEETAQLNQMAFQHALWQMSPEESEDFKKEISEYIDLAALSEFKVNLGDVAWPFDSKKAYQLLGVPVKEGSKTYKLLELKRTLLVAMITKVAEVKKANRGLDLENLPSDTHKALDAFMYDRALALNA